METTLEDLSIPTLWNQVNDIQQLIRVQLKDPGNTALGMELTRKHELAEAQKQETPLAQELEDIKMQVRGKRNELDRELNKGFYQGTLSFKQHPVREDRDEQSQEFRQLPRSTQKLYTAYNYLKRQETKRTEALRKCQEIMAHPPSDLPEIKNMQGELSALPHLGDYGQRAINDLTICISEMNRRLTAIRSKYDGRCLLGLMVGTLGLGAPALVATSLAFAHPEQTKEVLSHLEIPEWELTTIAAILFVIGCGYAANKYLIQPYREKFLDKPLEIAEQFMSILERSGIPRARVLNQPNNSQQLIEIFARYNGQLPDGNRLINQNPGLEQAPVFR